MWVHIFAVNILRTLNVHMSVCIHLYLVYFLAIELWKQSFDQQKCKRKIPKSNAKWCEIVLPLTWQSWHVTNYSCICKLQNYRRPSQLKLGIQTFSLGELNRFMHLEHWVRQVQLKTLRHKTRDTRIKVTRIHEQFMKLWRWPQPQHSKMQYIK